MLSILLPVLNESDNLKILIPELHKVLRREKFEIIVIDDNSKDDTEKTIKNFKKKYNIKYLLRKDKKGLSSAVVDGISLAKGDLILVMDSDLSHPPEVIPQILKSIREGNDIVVASRYAKGGGVVKWPLSRKWISVFATILAKPLVKVKDPLAGFFCFKRYVIEDSKLSPIGFKILLEILVKGKYNKVAEIPYVFQNRFTGESKADFKIYLQYNLHLLRLYFYKISSFLKGSLKFKV